MFKNVPFTFLLPMLLNLCKKMCILTYYQSALTWPCDPQIRLPCVSQWQLQGSRWSTKHEVYPSSECANSSVSFHSYVIQVF